LFFYTATYTDERDRDFALSLGAERFVVKPTEPDSLMGIIEETLRQSAAAVPKTPPRPAGKKSQEETVYLRQYNEAIIRKLEDKMEQLEQVNRKLEQNIAERKRAEAGLQTSYEKLQKMIDETIEALGKMGEMRDPYTAGHQSRVARLAVTIARETGALEKEMMVIGLLHDVGKIIVPVEILTKPGKLTEVEFQMIQPHSQAGYDILYGIEFPWPVALTVLQHHERMNGSGYPNRLAENQIIMEARILAVADVVEAMASHRPYRLAVGTENALEEISGNRGVLYDPRVVDACLGVFRKGFKFD